MTTKFDRRRRCGRCGTKGAAVAGCCGWATCERCLTSGRRDARRGFSLCLWCASSRERLVPGSTEPAAPIPVEFTPACDGCGVDLEDRDEVFCPTCKGRASR